jgi:choline kinase
MQNVEYAVIAAAGMGSRLGMGMPKALVSIEGKTLLSRLIETLELRIKTICVVVGYREDLIIDYCAQHHRNVIIARNPDFATTNTAASINIGSRLMKGKIIYLDADIVCDRASLIGFIDVAKNTELLVGVCRTHSENPVYVSVEDNLLDKTTGTITGFSREKKSPYEWANIFVASNSFLKEASNFVFEEINKKLPCDCHLLNSHEIDTESDLQSARAFLKKTQ